MPKKSIKAVETTEEEIKAPEEAPKVEAEEVEEEAKDEAETEDKVEEIEREVAEVDDAQATGYNCCGLGST